jgi:RES domain
MSKRRPTHPSNKPSTKSGRHHVPQLQYLLEHGSIENLIAAKERTQNLLKLHWDFYSELAYQRKQIESQLIAVLNKNATSDFTFKGWQRGVKYKYSLHPFSTVGSLSDPGGRFNIGDISVQNFPKFPALYIASDKGTALQETLGQPDTGSGKIDAMARALGNPQSVSYVAVSGHIDRIFDLRESRSLKEFVRLMKNFTFSKELCKRALDLGEQPLQVVGSVDQLMESLLSVEWRVWPMRFDLPANSQIFGQLLYTAQIEGVIYPSKFTGKECVALFPHHFASTNSFIEIDDEVPHEKVPRRIDAGNWKVCDQTPNERIGPPEKKDKE